MKKKYLYINIIDCDWISACSRCERFNTNDFVILYTFRLPHTVFSVFFSKDVFSFYGLGWGNGIFIACSNVFHSISGAQISFCDCVSVYDDDDDDDVDVPTLQTYVVCNIDRSHSFA